SHRHDVRDDSAMLGAEPGPRAPEAGLDLVQNQKRPVAICALAKALEEARGRRVKAARPLHRLDEVAGGLMRGELVAVKLVELGEGALGRFVLIEAPGTRAREV